MSSEFTNKNYLTNERLSAYIEQFKYLNSGDVALEIGGGAKVFAYLASKIATCKVADYDSGLSPDIVLDILDTEKFNHLKNKFSIVYCCQVLEHIPFKDFQVALNNIASLNSSTICISVPDNRRSIRFKFQLNRFKLKKVLTVPLTGYFVSMENHPSHHWEIYSKNYNSIVSIFKSLDNYSLVNNYRLYDRPYQHFFIFKKK